MKVMGIKAQQRLVPSVARLTVRCCAALLAALIAVAWVSPAAAQNCSPATSQGTAPSGWQTYCWLNFSTYNDTTARSAAGQNFSFALSDGSTLSLNVKTSTTSPVLAARAAPSWTGAAVGNTAFLGIPGNPILYQQAGGTTVLTFSGITVTPPPGVPPVTVYSFVAADAESTNQGESLSFVTNGTGWVELDEVPPISGSLYPTRTGAGTSTFTETGVAGTVGGYIVGSTGPTTVTTTLVGGGLQGAMFAVRFASLRLTKQISGARVNAADQFKFDIKATASGSVMATGTTSGTTLGPFSQAVATLASGVPLTIEESMAPGSVSSLAQYRSTLNCTNSTTNFPATQLPTNVVTTSYNFGALQFGDNILCTFTNQPFPHLRLTKALAGSGRRFTTDQFVMNIDQGASTVATTTTTGTGTTVTNGSTAQIQAIVGQSYSFNEIASGSTNLAQYTSVLACTRPASSSTALPTILGGTITPQMGDVIECTITNTPTAANALLTVVKFSTVISDPINGTINPKMIPGAVVRYSILVTNTGTLSVTGNSIVITDPLPTQFLYHAATPVSFTNGTPASGLNIFNPATMVTFSSATGGGTPFTYTPNTAGYDANVKGLRINPQGTMAGATAAGQPSFTISFLGQIN
jgi:hypothetical protein